MIYEELKQVVSGTEQYRGAVTIYELQAMPKNDYNSTMKFIIRLMKIINGLSYQGIIKGNVIKALNNDIINQHYSTALSFNAKSHMVVGPFVKILLEYIGDLNLKCENKGNFRKLKELVIEDLKGLPVDYDEFFNNDLTDNEKDEAEKRGELGLITGSKELDWKLMSFVLNTSEGQIVISERLHFLKLTNPQLISGIQNKLKELENYDAKIGIIFDNIEHVNPKSRKQIYALILQALLFNQPYYQYKGLVTAYDGLIEKGIIN